MSAPVLPPAPRPCESCPYRRDVPSGIWAKEEYSKLPEYDRETWAQPPSVFMCHQQNDRLCAGWVATYDICEMFSFRMACSLGRIAPEHIDAIIDYKTKVPVFGSGAEAAAHGLHDLNQPTAKSRAMAQKIAKGKARG